MRRVVWELRHLIQITEQSGHTQALHHTTASDCTSTIRFISTNAILCLLASGASQLCPGGLR